MTIKKLCLGALKQIGTGVYGLVGLGIVGETIDLSDAPSGDTNLDDIFGESYQTQTTVVPVTKETSTAVQQTTVSTDPVIKTKTGTVYKSIEDAVEGIEHKDSLIAQLREQVKRNTGNDPLVTQRQVAQEQPVNYVENGDRYFEDIAKAVENKDTKAYMEAQKKLIYDTLGPMAGTLTALGRANAERVVSEQLPEFKGFLSSEQYAKIAEDSPLLADAIKSAEMNPAASQQLPELYRIAYLASQGRRVPELVQSAAQQVQQVQPRPTVQSTQLPPATQNNGTPQVQPGMNTSAERKALIAQSEQRGLLNLKW